MANKMTKQEEIREGIADILEAGDMFLNAPEDLAGFIDKGAIKQSRADQIISYLHSQGLVIKVERALPDCECMWNCPMKDEYTAFELLVEER